MSKKWLRSNELRIELLERRDMLTSAVGSFTRLESYPGPDGDLYVASFGSIDHIAADEPSPPDASSGDLIERSSVVGSGTQPTYPPLDYSTGAYSLSSQSLAQIITPIGSSTAAPNLNQAAIEQTSISGSLGQPNPTLFRPSALAASGSYALGTFRFDDLDPMDPKLFWGNIHIFAGGTGIQGGSGEFTSTTDHQTGTITFNSNTAQFEVGTAGIRLIISRTRIVNSIPQTEAIGQIFAAGRDFSEVSSIGPSSSIKTWILEGSISDANGNQNTFRYESSGLNVFVSFLAPIQDEDIITFDADPGIWQSQTTSGIILHNDSSGLANGLFSRSLNTYGFAFDASQPPPPIGIMPGPGDDGAPGDSDGDGDMDSDDAAFFASLIQIWAEGGPTPLIVTTEEDIDDGDYSFGDLSLRETINLAGNNTLYPGADTIFFAPNVSHINVSSALTIGSGNEVKIVGPGADNLTIDGNLATRVFTVASGATATLRGLHITEGGGNAGSAVASSGTLNIDQSLIDESIARLGGGVNALAGTLNITNSTVANNSTATHTNSYYGGGVYFNANATGSIVNSTISSNTSPNGGGVYRSGSNPITILNSTITANTATASAGAGGVQGNNIAMHNTIVAGNIASSTKDIKGSFNSSSSYNLVGADDVTSNGIENGTNGNIVGSTSTPVNPLLGSLTDNGGSLPTHAPSSISPAIDKGNPSFALGSWLYDQRAAGYPRIMDGDAITGARVDIGAFEYEPQFPIMAILDDSGFWLESLEQQRQLIGSRNTVKDEALNQFVNEGELGNHSTTSYSSARQRNDSSPSSSRRVRDLETEPREEAFEELFAQD